jgi:hypothetical protein
MTASEAVQIVADKIGATKKEVIEALRYNIIIEAIGEQVAFLREDRKEGSNE